MTAKRSSHGRRIFLFGFLSSLQTLMPDKGIALSNVSYFLNLRIVMPSEIHTCDTFYASPSSREAYRDRRLTTNFELWVEIFLRADMFPYEDPKTVSVCPYPEKRSRHSFVNISPTLVIDTSMERSSRVLQHGNPKSWIFFKKVWNWRNWILSVPQVSVLREKESPWLRWYQSHISNWYINGKGRHLVSDGVVGALFGPPITEIKYWSKLLSLGILLWQQRLWSNLSAVQIPLVPWNEVDRYCYN